MGSLAQEDFVLIDCFPGIPNTLAPKPKNGFDSTNAGNRAASGSPTYPAGTKIQGFQDSTVGAGGSNVANKGYYTMLYAQYHDYTTGDCSAGQICTWACASSQALGEMGVSLDISGGNDVTMGGPCAIACVSVGDTQYGWFWVGGVCPNYDVTSMDDFSGFLTSGNVIQGCQLACARPADATRAALGQINGDGTATHPIVGRAFSDDT